MTSPALHIDRTVAPDGTPPFAPGVTVTVTYTLSCDVPVRVERIEQTLPNGWGCHPDARRVGLAHVGDTLTAEPKVVIQPGQPAQFVVPVMLNSFDTTAPLPSLLIDARTREQVPAVPSPLEPLPAPPAATVNVGLAARTTSHGKAQVAVRNGGNTPLTDVRVHVNGGRFVDSPSGDSSLTISHIDGGNTPIFDVIVTDPQNLVASLVAARTVHGMPLPDTMLPASANASVAPDKAPEPAPVRTVYQPQTLQYRPLEEVSDVTHPRQTVTAPPPPAPDEDEAADELAPKPAANVGAAAGIIDVVGVTRADGAKRLAVGDVIEVRALVVNGTDAPQHNVRVVAELPRYVTVRDDEWMHHPGGARRYVPYLPPRNEVSVPLKVRVDKAGDLTLRFAIDDGDSDA